MELLFRSLFLVLVSGVLSQAQDEHHHVYGVLNESVLLKCNCQNNLNKIFRWQNENETVAPMIFPSDHTKFNIKYKYRIESFPEDHGNCSILLKNITLDDNATYRCCFDSNLYEKHFVTLHVAPKTESRLGASSITPTEASLPSRANLTVIPAVVLLLLLLLLVVGYLYLHRKRNSAGTSTELV